MPQFAFGSGSLWGTRQDIANGTPVQFGTLQGVDVGFNASVKELFGQYQFPVAVGRGTGKVEGKAKLGRVQGRVFADLFFNSTLAAGQVATANNEAGSIPGTPYQITVANSATFTEDLGVIDVLTGNNLKKVASAPATGQYSVSAGVYTFAAADTGKAVLISYRYTISGSGQKMTITNGLLGSAPVFSCVLESIYSTNKLVLKLNQCVSTKLSLATKMDDFVIPEFDFSAFADASNNIGDLSFSSTD